MHLELQPRPFCPPSYQLNALQPQRNCENENNKMWKIGKMGSSRERDFQLKGIAALCGFLCLLASLSALHRHSPNRLPFQAKTTRKPCTFGNQFLLLLPLLFGGWLTIFANKLVPRRLLHGPQLHLENLKTIKEKMAWVVYISYFLISYILFVINITNPENTKSI